MSLIKSPLVVFLVIVSLLILSIANFIESQNLRVTLQATQDTGYLGDKFSVQLSDGRVVIAGVVMSQDMAKDFFYSYQNGYDVVTWRVSDEKSVQVIARVHSGSKK